MIQHLLERGSGNRPDQGAGGFRADVLFRFHFDPPVRIIPGKTGSPEDSGRAGFAGGRFVSGLRFIRNGNRRKLFRRSDRIPGRLLNRGKNRFFLLRGGLGLYRLFRLYGYFRPGGF